MEKNYPCSIRNRAKILSFTPPCFRKLVRIILRSDRNTRAWIKQLVKVKLEIQVEALLCRLSKYRSSIIQQSWRGRVFNPFTKLVILPCHPIIHVRWIDAWEGSCHFFSSKKKQILLERESRTNFRKDSKFSIFSPAADLQREKASRQNSLGPMGAIVERVKRGGRTATNNELEHNSGS